MPRAVLFRSINRFDAFVDVLRKRGVEVDILDFAGTAWLHYDFHRADFVIYYPSYELPSSNPLALHRVKDNLGFVHRHHPSLPMYPDPTLFPYYSDKYQQHLLLASSGFPYPQTIPVYDSEHAREAGHTLGFPLVVKNRYGAGGDFVFVCRNERELISCVRRSQYDFLHFGAIRSALRELGRRELWYFLLKRRQLPYPFLSPPLLVQKFVRHDRDLKTVVRNGEVVEAHWRRRADPGMWKLNIDGGAVGEWSALPEAAIELSSRLARMLGARWLNIDLIESEGRFFISEFSPVWHHYRYREKANFVYKDDYNLPIPLEEALDLETMIVDSLLEAARSLGTERPPARSGGGRS